MGLQLDNLKEYGKVVGLVFHVKLWWILYDIGCMNIHSHGDNIVMNIIWKVFNQWSSYFMFAKPHYVLYVCSTFDGRLPVLWVSDEDILKDVLVKDFGDFTNRRVGLT